jgi:hypothetical protein
MKCLLIVVALNENNEMKCEKAEANQYEAIQYQCENNEEI